MTHPDPDPNWIVALKRASEVQAVAIQFGFRRRCAWCGVVLRGWQLNLCSTCRPTFGNRLRGGWVPAPCPAGSRWDELPDGWSP